MSHSFITQLLLAVTYFAMGVTASEAYRTFPLQWRIARVVRYLERLGAHSATTATTVLIADGRPVDDAIAYLLAHNTIREPQASQYHLTRSRAEIMRWRARFGALYGFGTLAVAAAVYWVFKTI